MLLWNWCLSFIQLQLFCFAYKSEQTSRENNLPKLEALVGVTAFVTQNQLWHLQSTLIELSVHEFQCATHLTLCDKSSFSINSLIIIHIFNHLLATIAELHNSTLSSNYLDQILWGPPEFHSCFKLQWSFGSIIWGNFWWVEDPAPLFNKHNSAMFSKLRHLREIRHNEKKLRARSRLKTVLKIRSSC